PRGGRSCLPATTWRTLEVENAPGPGRRRSPLSTWWSRSKATAAHGPGPGRMPVHRKMRTPMRTTIDVDEALLAEAQRLTGQKEPAAVLHEGLMAWIER